MMGDVIYLYIYLILKINFNQKKIKKVLSHIIFVVIINHI